MTKSVAYRRLKRPLVFHRVKQEASPLPSKTEFANKEVIAIMPDLGAYSVPGVKDPVWAVDIENFICCSGAEYELCVVDYVACMTASREATPAEYAALKAVLDPEFSFPPPCEQRTQEMQDTAYREGLAADLRWIGGRISALSEWPGQEAPPRGLLEQVAVDVFDTISLTKYRVDVMQDENRWKDGGTTD